VERGRNDRNNRRNSQCNNSTKKKNMLKKYEKIRIKLSVSTDVNVLVESF
jgi:hypothetical protein